MQIRLHLWKKNHWDRGVFK